MNDIAFCSLAFGPRYIKQQWRLMDSIKQHEPGAKHFTWQDDYPPNALIHYDSLYGFKVHAVNYARGQGYKKIIWFDTACVLIDKVDYWFDIIKDYGVIAARDESLLSGTICDKALEYFAKIEGKDWHVNNIADWHLVGGSLYVFDFSLQLCNDIFYQWEAAEADGIFGSQYESASGQINSHRHDESCQSMALYLNGSKPVPYDICRYNNGDGSIVIKKHFK